jgi:hypothetical protein
VFLVLGYELLHGLDAASFVRGMVSLRCVDLRPNLMGALRPEITATVFLALHYKKNRNFYWSK